MSRIQAFSPLLRPLPLYFSRTATLHPQFAFSTTSPLHRGDQDPRYKRPKQISKKALRDQQEAAVAAAKELRLRNQAAPTKTYKHDEASHPFFTHFAEQKKSERNYNNAQSRLGHRGVKSNNERKINRIRNKVQASRNRFAPLSFSATGTNDRSFKTNNDNQPSPATAGKWSRSEAKAPRTRDRPFNTDSNRQSPAKPDKRSGHLSAQLQPADPSSKRTKSKPEFFQDMASHRSKKDAPIAPPPPPTRTTTWPPDPTSARTHSLKPEYKPSTPSPSTPSPKTNLAAHPLGPPRYLVSRSYTNNLPVYSDFKRGGNMELTTVRRVSGDPRALQAELKTVLAKKGGAPVDVGVNSLTGHVIVKGRCVDEVKEFLEGRGM